MQQASSPARGGATAALCFVIALFEGFDLQSAGVAAPKLAAAFHTTPATLGWFFSSSTFGLMLGAAIGGRLSDRFGRKAVLLASMAAFGLMSIANGLAQNFEMLVTARFLTGVGLGGALPTLIALANENADLGRKHSAVGLLYAGMPSGGAIASLVAASAIGADWRSVFFVGGIAPLVAVPLLLWALPDSHQFSAARATAQPGGRGFLFALFQEGRAARSLLLWVAFFFALLIMYLLLNWLPTLLISRGLSREQASMVQVAFNFSAAIASILLGLLMERVSLGKVTFACFGLATIGLIVLAAAPAAATLSLAVGGFVGFGVSTTQALLYAMAPVNYPTTVRGTGVGAAVSVGRFGSAAGPLLAASLLGAGRAPQEVLGALIPIVLASGAAALTLSVLMARAERVRPA